MEKILVLLVLAAALFIILHHNSVTYVLLSFDVERDLPPFLNSTLGLDSFNKVLDFLSEEKISATFFMTGDAMNRSGLVNRIIAEGHELASHSHTHANLTVMNRSGLENELKPFGKNNFSSFRPPFNQFTPELVETLLSFNYSVLAGITDYPRLLREGLLLIGSKPLFYPSSVYPRSWNEVFDETLSLQSGKKIKVVVVGIHPWEFVNLSAPGLEEYTLPSGDYVWKNLRDLVSHAKSTGAKFVTMKDFYALFNN